MEAVEFNEQQTEALAAYLLALRKLGAAFEVKTFIGGWRIWIRTD